AVVRDPASSGLDAKHKLLFEFLQTVNGESPAIDASHAARLRAAGWTDEELFFAITGGAPFNFYHRWIAASGGHGLADEPHRVGAKRSALHGYVRDDPR